MKHKLLLILMFLILALPIPVSLLSWIGTIISISDIGMTNIFGYSDIIKLIVALVSMFSVGLYPITYVISVCWTFIMKKVNIITFLPIAHIIWSVLYCFLWSKISY